MCLVGDEMHKKVLFCATVDSHIRGFHTPYLKFFKDSGWEVHVAAKGDLEISFCDKKFNICFERSPFKFNNIKAYIKLKRIMIENSYNIIHCHTPVAGVLARLAARKLRKKGTKVIYTAHGFHFYKGAPIKNWIFYYPIEKWLSRYTDCLITINEEDYQNALKGNFRALEIKKVNGVGVNLSKFYPADKKEKSELRAKYNLSEDAFILIYPAELNINKNQKLLVYIIANLKNKIPKLRLILPGRGNRKEYYREIAKKNHVDDIVQFPGYLSNIDEFIKLSDISVASSLREGLGLNVIEGMACGKPVVASDNRGHRELICNGENGYLFDPDDIKVASNLILRLHNSPYLQKQMGNVGIKQAKRYSLDAVIEEMRKIYESFM